MSSSMRNAIQRRNHKERAQPAERAKYGLLEKSKDYKKRAADHKSKQARLKILRSKATERNPDEFNFGMIRSRTRDGIKVTERPDSEVLGQDAVKLMKTQDAGYLRTMAGIEQKKIQKLEEELAFVGGGDQNASGGGKHTVFVDTEEEMKSFDPAEFFDTHPDLVDRTFNRPRLEQLASIGAPEEMEGAELKKLVKGRQAKYKELEARMKRQEELKKTERQMELQRARMQKGSMVGKNKWAKVRKR